MPTNLDIAISAIKKAEAEAAKLTKEWKAAKTPAEKDKLKKMAEAAKKIANLHFDSIDAAKVKDKAKMLDTFKEMGM